MAFRTSNDAAKGTIEALTLRVASGRIRFYSGTMPPDCETATADIVLLEFTLNAAAWNTPIDGAGKAVAEINTSPPLTATAGAGSETPADYARVYESNGTNCVWQDDSVGDTTSGARIQLTDDTVSTGQEYTITSWILEQPES